MYAGAQHAARTVSDYQTDTHPTRTQQFARAPIVSAHRCCVLLTVAEGKNEESAPT